MSHWVSEEGFCRVSGGWDLGGRGRASGGEGGRERGDRFSEILKRELQACCGRCGRGVCKWWLLDRDCQVLRRWVWWERSRKGWLLHESLRRRLQKVRAKSRNVRDEEGGVVFEIDHWIRGHQFCKRCVLFFQFCLAHDVSADYSL
jgi:hypothetical protein